MSRSTFTKLTEPNETRKRIILARFQLKYSSTKTVSELVYAEFDVERDTGLCTRQRRGSDRVISVINELQLCSKLQDSSYREGINLHLLHGPMTAVYPNWFLRLVLIMFY